MYHGRSGDSYEGSFSPGGVPSHSHSTPKSKGPIKRSVVVSFHIASYVHHASCSANHGMKQAQVHPEEQPKIQMNSFEVNNNL